MYYEEGILSSPARREKTRMSLFLDFLLFYDTIDDEKKNSIRKYVEGKNEKVFKDYEKTIFLFAFAQAC